LFTFLTLWLTFHPVVHFLLPAVELFEVLVHYANTGKETLSPFIDSSIDNVLLQTNPGCTTHFLTSRKIDGIYRRFLIHFNMYYAWSDFPR